MAMDKKQQQVVVLTVLSVSAFLYFYMYSPYGLKPTNEKIGQLTAELTNVQDKVESMKRTAQRLPALKREYDSLVAEMGQTEKRLPKEKSLEEILRIVTEQSLRYRIGVLSFTPGGGKEEAYYVEIPITLNVNGQFHMLGKFLASLGLQERILSARGLNMTYSPNPRKGQSVSGSFTLLAYAFKG